MSLKGRNFVDLADFERAELRQVLDTAHDLKEILRFGQHRVCTPAPGASLLRALPHGRNVLHGHLWDGPYYGPKNGFLKDCLSLYLFAPELALPSSMVGGLP